MAIWKVTADDTQIHGFCRPGDYTHSAAESAGVGDVGSTGCNSTRRKSRFCDAYDSLMATLDTVQSIEYARDLGIQLDSDPSTRPHITRTACSAPNSSISRSVSGDVVMSRSDYDGVCRYRCSKMKNKQNEPLKTSSPTMNLSLLLHQPHSTPTQLRCILSTYASRSAAQRLFHDVILCRQHR